VPVTWYDGDRVPPEEVQTLLGSLKFPGRDRYLSGQGADAAAAYCDADSLRCGNFTGYKLREAEKTDHTLSSRRRWLGNGKTSTPFDTRAADGVCAAGAAGDAIPEYTLQWHGEKAKVSGETPTRRWVFAAEVSRGVVGFGVG